MEMKIEISMLVLGCRPITRLKISKNDFLQDRRAQQDLLTAEINR